MTRTIRERSRARRTSAAPHCRRCRRCILARAASRRSDTRRISDSPRGARTWGGRPTCLCCQPGPPSGTRSRPSASCLRLRSPETNDHVIGTFCTLKSTGFLVTNSVTNFPTNRNSTFCQTERYQKHVTLSHFQLVFYPFPLISVSSLNKLL